MLFNSLQFAVFFIVTYILYIALKRRMQNILLLIASYFFYAYWDYRFLSLILILTIANYLFGIKINRLSGTPERKSWLVLSICLNLGFLAFFKYCNFFIDSFKGLFTLFGLNINTGTLDIILPLGISFYTFRILTYSIDIYRKEMAPVRNILDFAVFVAFFPLILAGPIERAGSLLRQISAKRQIEPGRLYEGGWLVFYGLFKKIFVADNLAKIVSQIFVSNGMGNGIMVLAGAYVFTFQIYADFSGYSDIARGISRLMGFEVIQNFKFPYFAANVSDFWRRWHISLSTWFRDYLYIPMGGSRVIPIFIYRNLLVTMCLAGLWHGAAWTFVIWGLYHGILLIIYHTYHSRKPFPVPAFIGAFFTFQLVALGWLIFRAESFSQLWSMVNSLIFNCEFVQGLGVKAIFVRVFALIWLMLLIDALQFRNDDLFNILKWPAAVKVLLYSTMLLLMFIYGDFGEKEFIYLRF